jgi:hypothetical protein
MINLLFIIQINNKSIEIKKKLDFQYVNSI